jgi:hypothetical protein
VTFTEFFQPSVRIDSAALQVANMNGLGLKVTWEIERGSTSVADKARVEIYNLAPAIRQAAHAAWRVASSSVVGYLASLSIGWGELVEQVIVGDVWNLLPAVRRGEDVVTVLEIGDGGRQIRDATIGQAFAESSLTVVLTFVVAQTIGLPIAPTSLALIQERGAQLPVLTWANYVATGSASDTLDEIFATLGLTWRIYNSQLVAFDRGLLGGQLDPIALLLQPSTGLLSWTALDDGGIELVALANPKLKIGGQVIVLDAFGVPVGGPAYRVDRVLWTGTTDGDSTMRLTGRQAVPL